MKLDVREVRKRCHVVITILFPAFSITRCEKLIGKNDWKNIDTNRRVIYSCIMCATCETCCYGKYIFIQIYFYKYILYKVSNDG